MKSDNKNKIGATHKSSFSRIDKIHPVKMLLYLCLIGIGTIFLILLLAYARTEVAMLQKVNVGFPKFFSVSTVLILVSSYTLLRTPRFYRKDNLTKMTRYLGISLALGFAFLLSQVGGWYELAKYGIYFKGKPYGSYLYLITALHALHVAAGMMFLIYMYFKTFFAAADPIRTLVFIRDPFRKLQLGLLTSYWHFMGALWLILYFVFLFLF
ncbi:cytochrome c oxidase subunit III [Adhaeribacter sp. BT258]|uniref:Cytochrome c oxidase subunit III n=1 Tax=Adhaeribacter terrigena TaxID=2793070 RepID=A0ABS1BZT4_9BACT|nr:cytochrome c oxidase subunit III [Adhaeribacter terrigena]MBK0402664.1 cytochrome c oxidase subunit III [Adhaeribacter terrigena]